MRSRLYDPDVDGGMPAPNATLFVANEKAMRVANRRCSSKKNDNSTDRMNLSF